MKNISTEIDVDCDFHSSFAKVPFIAS